LLDGANGRRITVLKGHNGSVRAVAFSPDGWWILTGGADRTARAWSAEDGRIVRTFEGHKTSVKWVGFNSTCTFACTWGENLQWWRLPDWRLAGFHPDFVISGEWNAAPSSAEFLHSEVVTFSFEGMGYYLAVAHRLGDQQRVVLSSPNMVADEIGFASDGRRILTSTGALYDLNQSGRMLPAPPGQKYHPDAGRLIGGQRLLVSSRGIIDLVTGKVITTDLRDCRTIGIPGCLCVGRSGDSLIITPSLDIDIPLATLELWVQVVARGELTATGQFQKWGEQTWDRKRQELASVARPVGAFPFPGHIAQDRLYWLRKEIEETGQKTEAIPLLDRLVAAEPAWPNYLRRGELLQGLVKPGLTARDYLEAGRLAGPRFWPWQREHLANLAWTIARRLGHSPGDYEAALTLARKASYEERLEQLIGPPDRIIGTLLYRLSRYPEAVDVLSRREREKVAKCLGAAFASPWVVPIFAQEVHDDIPTEAVRAMCFFRMGRHDAAIFRLGVARQVEEAGREEWKRSGERGHPAPGEVDLAFLREAEELIEGKKR
jgi:hypothetical protein